MKTLNLQQAANYLGIHKQTARRRVAEGIIPGSKVGRSWRFIQQDLAMYIRSLYSNPAASQGVIHRSTEQCRSANEVIPGGFVSVTKDKEYNEALGLPTNQQPNNTTIN